MNLVADELVRFDRLGFDLGTDEALAWTRPNFFALRYELVGPLGPLATVSVNGTGAKRHLLAETAAGNWRYEIFPLRFPDVHIFDAASGDKVATYYRYKVPKQIRVEDAETFHFQPDGPAKTLVRSEAGRPIYTLEQVEAFPRFRYQVRIEPSATRMPELPLLAATACCYLLW